MSDVDNDKCECRRGSQMQEAWEEITKDQQDLRKVLGATAPILKAAKFMKNTGLLGQFEAIP
ncbi:uncharacterized protein EAF01_005664 [Botrytis porri]|uniref:uncharacterized protein n=1 Tax=Botrytis porri TaxID=87229 RepID=UPI0019012AB5|nr:uncharacterized protein EAF01_005664 [Botrytis porri]KAF7905143.1 hypothetical protein EAF01_005664 [Botrytis porri]